MSNFEATITKEQVSALPPRSFSGEVLVVDSQETMRQAEDILRGQTLLGFDTETRPAFKKGEYHNLALLQISTSQTAILFRLQLEPLSSEVIAMLENEKVKKIGAAIADDIKAIQRMSRFTPRGFVDLQHIVSDWGIEDRSVRKMAAIILGFKVSKAQRLSNWEAVRLTDAQQDYAAMDAWVCRKIFEVLLTRHPYAGKSLVEIFR